MAEQRNNSVDQGAQAASRAAKATGRAAARGVKTVSKFLPPKVKIALAIILAIVLLFSVIVGGTSESSMDSTHFLTAKDAEEVNVPEDEEELSSVYSRRQSVEQTITLSSIIEEQKRKDREKVEQDLRREYAGSNVTIECDSDKAPIFLTGFPDLDAAAMGGGMGEHIAQTAERLAWPLGTPSSQYDWDTGGAPTAANKAAIEKWYPSQTSNRCKIVGCCCHSARVVMAEALGKKLGGTLLPNVFGNDNAIKALQEVFKDCNYEVFKYDGKESSLKRGDLLTWAWKKPGGHTCIYIGDGKVVEGSLGQKYFSHVSDYKTLDVDLNKYNYFVVSRSKDTGSGVINGGVSTSAQQVIEGACLWAEAIANDNRFHYGGSGNSNYNGHKMGCYFCGTNEWKKPDGMVDKMFSYCCNPFVSAAFAHGGGVPEMLERCKKGGGYGMEDWSDHPNWMACGHVPYDKLQRGDVLVSEGHVALYIGNGKVCHAAYEDDNVRGSDIWNKSITADDYWHGYDRVFRYVGTGGGVMEIPAGGGSTSKFTKKDSMTTLEEITASTGRLVDIGYVSSPYSNCAQSFAYVNNTFAVSFVKTNGPPGTVQLYSKDGRALGSARNDDILHANGSCATPDGNLLVAGKLSPRVAYTAETFSVSGNSISATGTKNLPRYTSSIAYDKETKKYICSAGGGMTVYDENFNEVGKVSRNMHGSYYQDIGAGNGFIFACHTSVKGSSLSHGSNYIDIYNESTGDYCGSYHVDYGELESCDVVDGELVLLVHLLGHENYIHFTGIMVNDGMSTGWNPNVVTQHDMDILSAYSISLANTALQYKKSGFFKNLDIGFLSYRYTDINGKPVKTYWFGEDKGKINYERDLKSKVNNWTFYDRQDMEITKNGSDVKVTIHETAPHKLCKRLFEVEPYAEYVNALGSPEPISEEEVEEMVEKAEEAVSTFDARNVDKDDPLLLLVNNDDKNAVPSDYDSSLVEIDPDGKGLTAGHDSCKYINSIAKDSLLKMLDDCPYDTIVQSSYRSYDVQKELYAAAVAAGRTDTTREGHSEHQTGLAADIIDASSAGWSDPLVEKQEATNAQQWLMANCQKYGFILRYPKGKESITGIDYEPWHYRYVGEKHAKEIMSNNLCLEEYVSGKVVDVVDASYSDSMKGKTTNAEAIYNLSTTTSEMIFIGMVERNVSGMGGVTIGGIDGFPIPQESGWYYTSPFGHRWGRLHAGIDLAAPAGTPIYSTCDGTVTRASFVGGLGNSVVIKGSDGKEYFYGHMTEIMATPGPVVKGQQIGTVGTTGNSTGNHLHYEIHVNGVAVDPFPMFSKSLQDLMNGRKSADFG